jgi:small subunit ribosomal protein S16
MALVIRLRQQGKTNQHSYRLVLTDERAPRDGGYKEMLGHYDPHQEGALVVKEERVQHWLQQGAQLSETAETLIKKVAPQVIADFKERQVVKRAKASAKRRARRKAA